MEDLRNVVYTIKNADRNIRVLDTVFFMWENNIVKGIVIRKDFGIRENFQGSFKTLEEYLPVLENEKETIYYTILADFSKRIHFTTEILSEDHFIFRTKDELIEHLILDE